MALTPRLDLRQSQQLVMTPQLQQAIKLLQLSNIEIADFVAEELERNPLLEIGDNDTNRFEEERGEAGGTQSEENLYGTDYPSNDHEGDYSSPDSEGGLIAADRSIASGVDTSNISDSPLDTSYDDNVFQHDSAADRMGEKNFDTGMSEQGLGEGANGLSLDGISGGSGSFNGSETSFEENAEEQPSLQEHLMRQMMIMIAEGPERFLAANLIDLIDEAGYLQNDAALELGTRLDLEESALEALIKKLQNLEPTGVFARSLKECLGLQLAEKDRLDPAMQALLDNLELLAKRDMTGLKKCCGVDDEDLKDMISELRALNPKPGLLFGASDTSPAIPDVFIRKAKGGSWIIELNTESLPKLLVNNHYLTELSSSSSDKEARSFISECQSNANWLIKALDQRARTILKVGGAIVKAQEAFFDHGIRYLKPMTLRDIADEIEMHESTVSRVTSNKFMSCPRGIFELKYFFSAAISSADGGDALSSEAVRHRLKELIDQESPKKILSDDQLVKIFKNEGIDIARRTIAKYREAMRIPSSVQRRRQKSIAR